MDISGKNGCGDIVIVNFSCQITKTFQQGSRHDYWLRISIIVTNSKRMLSRQYGDKQVVTRLGKAYLAVHHVGMSLMYCVGDTYIHVERVNTYGKYVKLSMTAELLSRRESKICELDFNC